LFIFGLASALGLSVVFIAGYVFSVAEEARRMSGALAASYLALDREQRVSALGALAAAAAHRLGSPLGTIAVVARSWRATLPPDSPHRADVELLLSESERCRTILDRAVRPARGRGPLQRMPLAALVETAAAPYRRRARPPDHRRQRGARLRGRPPTRPAGPAQPELVHGLGNLLQNAIEFARSEVRVTVRWSERRVSLKIRDDGRVRARPSRSPRRTLSIRGETQGRIGSGSPWASASSSPRPCSVRTGAQLSFGNGQDSGAELRSREPFGAGIRTTAGMTKVRYDGQEAVTPSPAVRVAATIERDPADRRRRRPIPAAAGAGDGAARLCRDDGRDRRRGIEAAGSQRPAFAVVDLRLGDGNGLEVVPALRAARPTPHHRAHGLRQYRLGRGGGEAGRGRLPVEPGRRRRHRDGTPAARPQPAAAARAADDRRPRALGTYSTACSMQCDRNVSETARRPAHAPSYAAAHPQQICAARG
jgi:hypothetical protein